MNSKITLDESTKKLIDDLFSSEKNNVCDSSATKQIAGLLKKSRSTNITGNIIKLFIQLQNMSGERMISPRAFGITKKELVDLAKKHENLDEHRVTVGGRINKALDIVRVAGCRVSDYLARKEIEARSGIELWAQIQENHSRIKSVLGMSNRDWNSFSGQMRYAMESLNKLAEILKLPAKALEEVGKVTKNYRMRVTPYYAGLIMQGKLDDPVLLQAIPTGEMLNNAGTEIPPVAADHSPARLIDQFYPRVVTIKCTNMCAMYCTHCLRIAHIGKKDRIYSQEAYKEALDYIRSDSKIRDVLVTGGDAFMLPDDKLKMLLAELDGIEHVRVKRLGTRTPITTPQRISDKLLDILKRSNDKKPLRVVTQINTAQEITPQSAETLKQISKSVSSIMNQAVLLKGVNDTKAKMWKLCETAQEAYVRPYYVFNCSYRNPQFAHLRVPVEKGRNIIESMYGNISGDAIPRYIATAEGKIPLHRSNVSAQEGCDLILTKPWDGEQVRYPDADPETYANRQFAFEKHRKHPSC